MGDPYGDQKSLTGYVRVVTMICTWMFSPSISFYTHEPRGGRSDPRPRVEREWEPPCQRDPYLWRLEHSHNQIRGGVLNPIACKAPTSSLSHFHKRSPRLGGHYALPKPLKVPHRGEQCGVNESVINPMSSTVFIIDFLCGRTFNSVSVYHYPHMPTTAPRIPLRCASREARCPSCTRT
jgi:hypothetical protein